MIQVSEVTQFVVIAGLVGAIVWDLLTWWWALPTSSSHALIDGYAGAAVMRSGFGVIIPAGWSKTLLFIVVAPLTGLVLGFSFMVAIFWLLRNKAPQRVDYGSVDFSYSLLHRTASGMAATMHKKPWVLSPLPSSELDTCQKPSLLAIGGDFIGRSFLLPTQQ